MDIVCTQFLVSVILHLTVKSLSLLDVFLFYLGGLSSLVLCV